MTDELTEAARRLSRPDDYGTTYPGDRDQRVSRIIADAATLARAWLAERDPEPADGPWLESVGFTETSDEGDVPVRLELPGTGRPLVLIGLETSHLFVGGSHIRENPTRGHVLTLLRALGTQGVPR